ncbi:hypothetical protein [Cobetia crustatorum]|uniref:hypothetical protein n=1 Tax=Cobetia crustatorum TaxID=553385 RepID=UPI00046AC449|nr:hypothetical protein [Cobetia crustatorum]
MPEPHNVSDSVSPNDSPNDHSQPLHDSTHADEAATPSTPVAKPPRDTRLRNRLFWMLLAAALLTGFWLA